MNDGAEDNTQARKHRRKETTLTSSHMHSLTQMLNCLSSTALSAPSNSYPATPLCLQSIPITMSICVPAPPSNQLVSNLQQLPPGVSQSTLFSHAHSYYQQHTPLVHNPYAHLLYYSCLPSHQGYAPLPPQCTPSVGIDQDQTRSVKGSVNKGGVSQFLLTDQVNRCHGIPVIMAIWCWCQYFPLSMYILVVMVIMPHCNLCESTMFIC